MTTNYTKGENREETGCDRECYLLLYIGRFFTKIREQDFKLKTCKYNKMLELVESYERSRIYM